MKNHILYTGKLEKQILKHLALKPNKLVKPLSTEIKKDYKNVHNAVKNLYNKGCLTKVLGKSEKGVPYDAYRLSETGIAIILTDPTFDVSYDELEVFSKEYPDSQVLQILELIGQILGKESVEKIRMFASSVYLTTLRQLKKKVLTKKQMMPVVFSSLYTYLYQVYQGKEEDLDKIFEAFEEKGLLKLEIPSEIRKLVRINETKSEQKG